MYEFLSGLIAMSCLVVGLFFTKFYKKIGDRFFLYFAFAFFCFAFERLLLVLARIQEEVQTSIYLIRLVGFLIILAAIYDKNRISKLKKD